MNANNLFGSVWCLVSAQFYGRLDGKLKLNNTTYVEHLPFINAHHCVNYMLFRLA